MDPLAKRNLIVAFCFLGAVFIFVMPSLSDFSFRHSWGGPPSPSWTFRVVGVVFLATVLLILFF